MIKDIVLNNEAREKIKNGVNKLADIVKLTIGPKGRNVAIERKNQLPLITNDGVTIAKEIFFEDKFENMGASIIKEASIKTNDLAGDGTTTSIVLAQSIINEGLKNITAGANPILIKKGIQNATKVALSELKKLSKPVKTNTEIMQVASVSTASEEDGKLIASAVEKVGQNGIITIEESNNEETKLKIVEGFSFDKGYVSNYLCNNTEKMLCEFEDCYILLTDKKICSINEILPVLEKCIKNNLKLLIVASDIENEVLATVVINKMRGTLQCEIVKAPSFGDNKKSVLEDISVFTGATLFSAELGLDINNCTLEQLGRAKKIIVDKNSTTIINGFGDKQKIEERVAEIKNQIKNSADSFEKSQLSNRLSKLSGGVAIIEVGAPTEIEMKERKLRMEDGLSATKSAIEEGLVAGGGVALLKISESVEKYCNTLSGDEKLGAKILLNALYSPIKQIVENSGENSGIIIYNIIESQSKSYGYDALNLCYCDMFESGIIDPAKVTRCALQNASSVASTLLTTECLIAEK